MSTSKNAGPKNATQPGSVTTPGGGRPLGQEKKGSLYTGVGGEARGRGGLMPGDSPRK